MKYIKNYLHIKKLFQIMIIIIFIFALLILLRYIIFDNQFTFIKTKPKIERIHAQYSNEYDGTIESKQKESDIVLQGKIISCEGQKYYDEGIIHKPNGRDVEIYNIHTLYKVQVDKVLKGDYDRNEIIINKFGGLSKDGRVIQVLENDQLPELGKEYIFSIDMINGLYIVSGENSNISY